ncbi:MAG: hypothetical protein IPN95_30400 [Bacteroidetes bacterium]|nr:hypothetical protein [Bacteroidota bacterium]
MGIYNDKPAYYDVSLKNGSSPVSAGGRCARRAFIRLSRDDPSGLGGFARLYRGNAPTLDRRSGMFAD